MRTPIASFGLVALLVAAAEPLPAQGLFTDARSIGMGGVSLSVDGSLSRYNPAFRAVPPRAAAAGPKVTIPVPLGLIQFFHDHPISSLGSDPLFHPDSARFNPVELLDLILNPPLYLEVKQPPTPTNDWAIGVGKDSFQVDLGKAQALIPTDQFGIRGSSRPIDIEPGFKGLRAGAMVFLHDDVELQLGDNLLGLLKNADTARDNTPYTVDADAIVEGGIAPSVGWSGKLYGDATRSVYVGVAAHYYLGMAYGSAIGAGGITTGSPIFGGSINPTATTVNTYSKWGNSPGHGVGGDVGVAWVSGPIVFGVGVNDIGATLTWSDTRIDFQHFDTTTNAIVTDSSILHVETKTKLPVSYLANVIYSLDGTTVAADVRSAAGRTTLHIGAEQRFGPWAVRGGIARDQRKKVEFAWGGGMRFGPFGLDVGFWTHSNALSDERAITMATSLSIY